MIIPSRSGVLGVGSKDANVKIVLKFWLIIGGVGVKSGIGSELLSAFILKRIVIF